MDNFNCRMILTERGSSGLLAILIMPLLLFFGIALHALTSTELTTSISFRQGIAAQHLAESGVQHAIVKLKTNRSFIDTTNTKQVSAANTLNSSNQLHGAGSYKVIVTGSGNNRSIAAIGQSGKAKRQLVVAAVLQDSIYDYAAVAGQYMTINDAVYGNVGLHESRDYLTQNGTIHGELEFHRSDLVYPKIPVPLESGFYSQGDHSLGSTYDSGDKRLSGLYFIDSNFTMNGGKFYSDPSDPATLYVHGDAIFSGHIQGNLTVIASGFITFNSGSTIPEQIQLYAGRDITLNRMASGQALIMANESIYLNSPSKLDKAVLYAANDLHINASITGIAIAGKNLVQNSGGIIIYDQTAAQYYELIPNDSRVKIVSWKNQG